ncbi:MAG: prepilin-type N-terminal cleavage/methylation domain-containing protein [Pseudomonadota bacterium]
MLSRAQSPARQTGFTLVETMVAMVAGLLVVGAGVAMLSSTFGSNSSALRMTRMNQDLRGILNAINYDIGRAGAWGLATQVAQASSEADLQFSGTTGTITASALKRSSAVPYEGFATPMDATALTGLTLILIIPNASSVATRYELSIAGVTSTTSLSLTIPSGVTLPSLQVRAGSWAILNPFRPITVGGGNCILFSYDLDTDGVFDANERFGYRFDSTDGAIESTTTATSCTAGSAWENVTDENVLQISDFAVAQVSTPVVAVLTSNPPSPTPPATLLSTQVREYSVALSGQLRSDAAAQRNLRTVVGVRNHLVE